MYIETEESMDARIRIIISRLHRNELLRQIELAEAFGTDLYNLVYTRLCYFMKLGKVEINRLAKEANEQRQQFVLRNFY